MNTEEQFLLNKIRCEVAMQETLKSWHPKPINSEIECPRCKSNQIRKYGSFQGVQKYICKKCKRTFLERPIFICDCSIPGKQLKCQKCPQFQDFLEIVRQRINSLATLSPVELQRLKLEIEMTNNALSSNLNNSNNHQE
ncbi:IS1 family transposase [Anabaena sp. UHCC 0253]|uniref:IS1 family transposase n=1 Tax=Anabaena sp. UHCC 0253 TaxID=2590019 RepID=UPI0014458CFD|nr:IS1 family transposase [Anabaena sp. UHCC 0253]MTJ52650.1 IS1 family transposase [Anabaena sp. UHCC 0253]